MAGCEDSVAEQIRVLAGCDVTDFIATECARPGRSADSRAAAEVS